MHAMNWTAILALLAANIILAWLLWFAEERAQAARRDARHDQGIANSCEIENAALRHELETEKRLHRNLLARQSRRQSRPGQRAGETDNG